MDNMRLTRISTKPWQEEGYSPRSELLVERACWMKADGKGYPEIAKKLGISETTARRYVRMAEPSLDEEGDRDLGELEPA